MSAVPTSSVSNASAAQLVRPLLTGGLMPALHHRPAPVVDGIAVTNAARVLEPTGITKLDLVRYYDAVADRMLPDLRGRPLTLVRWSPQDAGGKGGVFMRHGKAWGPPQLRRVPIQEKTKVGEYLYVDSREAIVALGQWDMLEIHTWNSRVEELERPDRLVFDVDPDVSLGWDEAVLAATRIRERLAASRLRSFVKTTGGKGLHVVVPLEPSAGWDACFAFARDVVQAIERDWPREYVTTMAKARRAGKVFLDYLRNHRASTSVAAFSPRAKPGAPVSVPIAWDRLEGADPSAFTVDSVPPLLARRRADPWAGYDALRQRLPRNVR